MLPGCEELKPFDVGSTKVHIRGPSSPFELTFTAASEGLRGREARAHCDSINAAPVHVFSGKKSSKCEFCLFSMNNVIFQHGINRLVRILVAERLKLDGAGNAIVAHSTSLLDMSPGQMTLFCLMFAPFVEFR